MIGVCVVAAGMASLWSPPTPSDGESLEARELRYAVIAEAIAAASSNREQAAALVALSWHESGWHWRIHAGRCRPLECDPLRRRGVTIAHHAVGIWQLHQHGYLPREVWASLAGVDAAATSRSAIEASKALLRARGHCRGDRTTRAERMVSLYATGSRCSWSGARARVATMARVEGAMRAAAGCTDPP